MVTLFVLETLVKQRHTEALVRLLSKWDFLAYLETESGKKKRDIQLLSVLEYLAETKVTQEVMVRMRPQFRSSPCQYHLTFFQLSR